MIFTSIEFAFFLPIVFAIYWLLNKQLKLQNFFVLVASYFFYGWWDWRFLILIFLSTSTDYFLANKINSTDNQQLKKRWLYSSLFINLSFLGFFKYYNFFVESMADSFTFFGSSISVNRLNIILPVGISFYTFQSLSYIIDVYRKNIAPSKDIVSFFAFVSFFPQLVAGPIERASNLLPQFYKKRVFDYPLAVIGMRQILWGIFKKVVIADNCALYVDNLFQYYPEYTGGTLILGVILFSFQIYGDFSGYTDIAIGTARLFGFELKKNFSFPYFSQNISEFWRNWHISLSTWFKDYIYLPLGGNKKGRGKHLRNVFLVFLVSGFWHGANWTFIFWGLIHALFLMGYIVFEKQIKSIIKILPQFFANGFSMLVTFIIVSFAWIFFRSENMTQATDFISVLMNKNWFTLPSIEYKYIVLLLVFFIATEFVGRKQEFAIEKLKYLRFSALRWLYYCFIIFLIAAFMVSEETPFIYFQF